MQTTMASPDTAVAVRATTGRVRQAALVLGAGIGLAGGYSAAYFGTLSVFLKPIAANFHWSRAETSAVSVLAQIGIAIGAPLVGRLIDRHGAAKVIAPSTVLFAIALYLLTTVPDSLWSFGALSLVIGFVAVATTPVGYLSVLSRAFDRHLGVALGLAMLGLGSGTVLFPMIVQGWIAGSGWQSAYHHVAGVVLGLGALALCLVFGVGRGGVHTGPAQRGDSGSAGLPGDRFADAVRTGRFWLIALIFFAVSAAALGAVVHLFSLLSDRGIPPAEAAKGASLIGVGVMLGRFGAGVLMDYVHARYVAALAFVLGALGLSLIAFVPDASFAVIALSATLFGFAIGAEGDFIPFFVRRYFGPRYLGLFYGVLLCVYSLGGVAGPVLYGLAFDKLGSYTAALAAGALICVICAAAVLTLGDYRYAAPPRQPGRRA